MYDVNNLLKIFFKGCKMMTLKQISDSLKDRRLTVISQATGVHWNTIRNIRDNADANPTYQVMVKLSDYLSKKGK